MQRTEFRDLPSEAAWRLRGAYEGFEVVRFARADAGQRLEGTSVGVEEGIPWTIHYVIDVSADWRVRHARLSDLAGTEVTITTDGAGHWTIDGEERPELAGCLDLDLEASVVTNTLPVHRLALEVGAQGESAAAYVRTIGLAVERLDQNYLRLPDADGRLRFDYSSPRFGYRDTLQFGPDGLTVAYPGIGLRVIG